jgi:hypothetical protein
MKNTRDLERTPKPQNLPSRGSLVEHPIHQSRYNGVFPYRDTVEWR